MEDLTSACGDLNAVAALRAALGRLRILVVEDHPLNQRLCMQMLRKLGCAVDCVDNGRQALMAVDAKPYDLVFMDCHMPEMDGVAATQAIRARERAAGNLHHTRIVALTADAMPANRERCMAAGMDDFISKPFSVAQLQQAMVPALARPMGAMQAVHAVLNIARLEQLCAEVDDENILELCQMFVEELPGRLHEFGELIEAEALASLRLRAHSLKGVAASVGALELQNRAAIFEQTAQGGSRRLIAEELACIHAVGHRAAHALKNWMRGRQIALRGSQ